MNRVARVQALRSSGAAGPHGGRPTRAAELAAALDDQDPAENDDVRTRLRDEVVRRVLRDAIAYGVLCTDRAWNGVTMGDDQADTDRRLDAMVAHYLAQS